MKFSCFGFLNELGKVLNDCRSLNFDQLPDYGAIRRSFASLAEKMGYSSDSGPLDWSPRYPKTFILILDEPEISIPDERTMTIWGRTATPGWTLTVGSAMGNETRT